MRENTQKLTYTDHKNLGQYYLHNTKKHEHTHRNRHTDEFPITGLVAEYLYTDSSKEYKLSLPTLTAEDVIATESDIDSIKAPTVLLKEDDYSVKSTDSYIYSSGDNTFTLPNATGSNIIYIKSIKGIAKIVPTGDEKIYDDEDNPETEVTFDYPDMFAFVPRANNWYIQ